MRIVSHWQDLINGGLYRALAIAFVSGDAHRSVSRALLAKNALGADHLGQKSIPDHVKSTRASIIRALNRLRNTWTDHLREVPALTVVSHTELTQATSAADGSARQTSDRSARQTAESFAHPLRKPTLQSAASTSASSLLPAGPEGQVQVRERKATFDFMSLAGEQGSRDVQCLARNEGGKSLAAESGRKAPSTGRSLAQLETPPDEPPDDPHDPSWAMFADWV